MKETPCLTVAGINQRCSESTNVATGRLFVKDGDQNTFGVVKVLHAAIPHGVFD